MLYSNSTIKECEVQALKDITNNGKINDWQGKKLNTQYIADSYYRIAELSQSEKYYKKSLRVLDCGSNLKFKKFKDNSMKLHWADFCKDRLCPMCNWRRSLKIFGQVSKVMDKLCNDNKYRFVFLTLTCKNVVDDDLSDMITHLFKSYDRLFKHRKIKRVIKGWFRALEITHNYETDTYHPHFHVILCVEKDYFKKSEKYISQSEFTDMWKLALQADYTPIVNVKAFKTSSSATVKKSVAETAKYTVKDSDLVVKGDRAYTDRIVYTIDNALYNRRLCAFGGILKKLHKELNLDDSVDGDLINTNNDDIELLEDLDYVIVKYNWHVGYNNYILKK